jgi:hypothetical protein
MAANARSSFVPSPAGTVTVAATTTSGSTRVALVGGGRNLLITNAGSGTAFIEFGTSTATAATTTGMPLLSGEILCIGRPDVSGAPATHAVAITATGTATVYVTTGDGD